MAMAGMLVVVDVANAEMVVSAVTRTAGPERLSELATRCSGGSEGGSAFTLSTRMMTESTCTPSTMRGSSDAIDGNLTPMAQAMPKPPPTESSTLTVAITPSSTRERWSEPSGPSVHATKMEMMVMPSAKSGMSPDTSRLTSSSNERLEKWVTSRTAESTEPAMPSFHAWAQRGEERDGAPRVSAREVVVAAGRARWALGMRAHGLDVVGRPLVRVERVDEHDGLGALDSLRPIGRLAEDDVACKALDVAHLVQLCDSLEHLRVGALERVRVVIPEREEVGRVAVVLLARVGLVVVLGQALARVREPDRLPAHLGLQLDGELVRGEELLDARPVKDVARLGARVHEERVAVDAKLGLEVLPVLVAPARRGHPQVI